MGTHPGTHSIVSLEITMSGKNKDRVRITVDLTTQFHQRLEELESLVGANSKADVIRDALRLYEYICRRVIENGDKLQAVGSSGEPETLVIFA